METEVKINAREIMARLLRIQTGIDYIKEHIDDTTLSEEDLVAIKEAKEDIKKGKTRRL